MGGDFFQVFNILINTREDKYACFMQMCVNYYCSNPKQQKILIYFDWALDALLCLVCCEQGSIAHVCCCCYEQQQLLQSRLRVLVISVILLHAGVGPRYNSVPVQHRPQHGVRKQSYRVIPAMYSVPVELAWKLTADCNRPVRTRSSLSRRHR